MTLDEFVNRALDVPFKEKGRSYDGWDCWGLIYVAYRDVYETTLPIYTGEYHSTRRREELQNLITQRKMGGWKLNNPHQPGNVALVRMMGRDCHIGLMLSGWDMLHVVSGVSAAIEPINRPPWRDEAYDKVEGIYRYVG
jgi:cell wall-associated NlpC family hydrolase